MLKKGPYNPTETEKDILDFWLKHQMYKPEYDPASGKVMSEEEMKNDSREPFAIVCPPPNAYARPHIGNVSGYSYQDVFARYARMNGKKVLMIPGKDHAAQEAEVIYLRDVLGKQGKRKEDFTREQFYKDCYEYFTGIAKIAQNDEKTIGLSADFDRDIFTLDPRVAEVIYSTFFKMYQDGMVYKDVRIVNWSPGMGSVVPDIETDHKEREADLVYIKYPLSNGKGHISVATTRAETMLGDTAVVVDPSDPRYFDLIGEYVDLPLTDRKIPIIANGRVDKEFGTGAVKLTPAHAPDDYTMMLEWNYKKDFQHMPKEISEAREKIGEVSYINVVNKESKMVGPSGKYLGMPVLEAREQIIEDLRKLDLIEKVEKITQNVLICDRSKTVIEPIMSSQWFIDVEKLKQPAIDAIKKGDVVVHPESMQNKVLLWLENLRDWPISRSIWWGYRFPVWYKGQLTEDVNIEGKIVLKIGGHEFTDMNDAVEKGLMKVQQENPSSGLEINIRKATPADAGAMHEISVCGWHQNFTDETKGITKEVLMEKHGKRSGDQAGIDKLGEVIKSNSEIFYVAEKNNQVIGWVNLENINNEQTKWLNVYVDEKHQRSGVGTLLVTEILKQFGSLEIHIATPKKANLTKFYSKFDFQEYDQNDKNDYGIDIIQMKRAPQRIELDASVNGGWTQDSDVFDTWFSSGQWPFATLTAWNLMNTFYPTQIMEMAYGILELWASRMIMLGLYVTGQVPFKDVYIQGHIKAADGRKMSKSLGNAVSIDDLKGDYGVDAMRLFYIVGNKAGADYRVDYEKLEGNKRFINKVWNASKFVLGNVSDITAPLTKLEEIDIHTLKQESNHKLVEHVLQTHAEVTKLIDNLNIGIASQILFDNFWHTFCDVCLEEAKPHIYTQKNKETGEVISEPAAEEKSETQKVLKWALIQYLKMLHPFIPFVTEAIWQEVDGNRDRSLMYQSWK